MRSLNLSSRIIMFAICSSIEYDLKKYILNSESVIDFTDDMLQKAKFRDSKIDASNNEIVLNQLDLGDYVEIICSNPYKYKINNEIANNLKKYFETIIPVRNRVMHTKPLELGDRSVLFEILERIEYDIKWINWVETKKTREILHEDPSMLIVKNYPMAKVEYNPRIYHNLPAPEFDDTGYIGRRTEMKEIKELIKNNKNQIITIVGDGGIGKTAIAVKTLYDLIDDDETVFDAIIWISLKTRTLSKGEFEEIRQAIDTIPDMFLEGERNIICNDNCTPRENLLVFMDAFKVLLVIDNLETINNQEISSFLKDVPENSKVLITSRHGIGELEYRYVLEGMNATDAIAYFRELSKFYGLQLHKKHDKNIKDLVNNELYSNPLSIKWFISGIFNGLDEQSLLANKSKLVEFCMSNVFDKLNENSRKILQLFLIENKQLTLGEIDYLIGMNEVDLRKSINELLSTNMIKIYWSKYSLNDMAREFLSIYHPPNNDFVAEIMKKRRELNIMLQNIRVMNENDPFNPKSISPNLEDNNSKLSCYYLTKALEASSCSLWEDSFGFIEKAANITPNFFEVYKIKAFISAGKNELFDAIENYNIALSKCNTDLEKASVLYLFATFYVIKLSEYEFALDLIQKAEKHCPGETNILLEKSRILMYLGKYEEAEEVLGLIVVKKSELDKKRQNILACRYADLYRRQAENLELRDAEKKLELFKKGINEIEKLQQIDTKSYLTMIKILKDMSFLYFEKDAMEYLLSVLNRHFSELESIKHKDYKKLKDVIIEHKEEIPGDLYESLKRYIHDPKIEANHIYSKNEGVVVFMKGYFGFIANAKNNSIYFNKNNLCETVEYGDKVCFELYENYKGKAAKSIRKLN